jgi:hypothetical protein
MKDTVGRGLCNNRYESLLRRIDLLQRRYNALFDFLAGELGFEAVKVWAPHMYGPIKISPRLVATEQDPPRVVRTKEAK